ncbi:MAG: hypothetical protein P1S59_06450 [bacterium]|nr:hypothetical protein [bacterium]
MIDPGDQKGGISMGREDKIRQVAKLLGQTDSAHHSYEIKVLNGDRDSHWPEWFAEDLIGHGFDMVLEDRLARFLETLDEVRKGSSNLMDWRDGTARRMVDTLV